VQGWRDWGQRLGCLGRQAGFGWVAEARETGKAWKSREPPDEGAGPPTIELSCRPGPLTRRPGLTLFPCTDKMPTASQDVWVWISVADRKRGFEGGLWCQGMSRVCPGCPRTTPREAREGSCIRKAYGGNPGTKAEGRV